MIKMLKYECFRCGFRTMRRSNLKEHFMKKNTCKALIDDISIEECMRRLNEKEKPKCGDCGKVFSRISNLKRHRLNCKDKRVKELEEENKILKESRNINIVDNSIHIHTNIHVNSFKNTNFDVVEDDIENIKLENRKKVDIIGMLLKVIHFNEKYPENHNLYLENASSKRLMKLDGQHFVEDDRGDRAIEKFLKNDIDMYMDKYLSDKAIYNIYEQFIVEYNNLNADDRKSKQKDNDKRSYILNQLKNILYNGRHMVKDTARKNGIKI